MKKKILNSWDLENKFYFNINSSRLKKIITHYEIFKKSINVKGSIVECEFSKEIVLTDYCCLETC